MIRINIRLITIASLMAMSAVADDADRSAASQASVTSLPSIGFLLVEGETFYCAPGNEDAAVVEEFHASHDLTEFFKYLPSPAPLPADDEQRALEKLGLTQGQHFVGLLPVTEEIVLLKLNGISLDPSGDGGYARFLYRFDTSRRRISKDSWGPTGICWPVKETRGGYLDAFWIVNQQVLSQPL